MRLTVPQCVDHLRAAGEYVEAMLGIGQVHIEQARLVAGVLVPALEGVDSEQYKELNQEELEDLSKAQGRDANAKLKVALEKVCSFLESPPYNRFSKVPRLVYLE